MPLLFKVRILYFITFYIGTFLCVDSAFSAMDPRFELDPQSLVGTKSAKKPQQAKLKQSSRDHVSKSSSTSAKGAVYTVQPGDHLFKILMRDYGLSSNEAELFIEEIKRENNIYDIKRIKIGQKIVIPPVRRLSDGTLRLFQENKPSRPHNSIPGDAPQQTFTLESPAAEISENEIVTRAHNVWNQIVPLKIEHVNPLTFQTPTFSLTLDPQRYPTFTRADGGRIVLDQNGRIPPLVKSLIENKDSSVKIVTEAPSETKHFMASLLNAAGFYSVEENFNMEFGVDPKLTVQADFKIEKTAESLIKQDVVLVNSGRTSVPIFLGEFLKKEGFSLYEPFATVKPLAKHDLRTIHSVSATKQPEMIDTILSALSVSPERNRNVDVFGSDNNGISLSVKAERYFERGGQRYIITSFDGDPMNYTLFRILETKGYKVVILEAQDDFRKVSEKIILRMKIKGGFAQHRLVQAGSAGYSLQMSGFKLDDDMLPGGGVFLTDRVMDRIVRDLFIDSGFNINSQ